MEQGLIESTENLFEAALETMKKKNADYAGDSSSMRNFELAADIAGITMSKGILVRLMDKMTRIGNLMDKPPAVVEESVFDTIQDAINYSAILLYALKLEGEDRLNHVKVGAYIPGQRFIEEKKEKSHYVPGQKGQKGNGDTYE